MTNRIIPRCAPTRRDGAVNWLEQRCRKIPSLQNESGNSCRSRSRCYLSQPRYHEIMNLRVALGITLSVALLVGCSSVYYSAWEKVGVYKRDLLKKRVIAA